jgi:hypothetical protein
MCFHVPLLQWSLQFLVSFHFPFPYFVLFVLRYFPFHMVCLFKNNMKNINYKLCMISLPVHLLFINILIHPFLPSSLSPKCCTILPSFWGKAPHLRWWLITCLHQIISYQRFSGVFLSHNRLIIRRLTWQEQMAIG